MGDRELSDSNGGIEVYITRLGDVVVIVYPASGERGVAVYLDPDEAEQFGKGMVAAAKRSREIVASN